MGDLYRIADRRAVTAPVQIAAWRLLAERSGYVLAALEGAMAGSRRAGVATLIAEAAGLRAALEYAAEFQLMMEILWKDGFEHGRAAKGPSGRKPT